MPLCASLRKAPFGQLSSLVWFCESEENHPFGCTDLAAIGIILSASDFEFNVSVPKKWLLYTLTPQSKATGSLSFASVIFSVQYLSNPRISGFTHPFSPHCYSTVVALLNQF